MLEQSLLEGLNPEQAEAVRTTEGPLLVLAGAGSGKTRVLTQRIAWLIGVNGIAPESILAVTFTNKAAGEMRERVEKILGPEARDVWLSTFHSACVRILRREIGHLGRSRSFVIYDETDALATVKEATGTPSATEMIQHLVEDQGLVVASARELFEVAEGAKDQASADLAVRRIDVHEKNAWMLRSHLE